MSEYRKAIGAVILDKNNNLLAFQRNDFPESFQGIEGGVDNDEPINALYRELWEEIGLNKDDYNILGETKDFIKYLFKPEKRIENFIGQEKKFYLIKLNKNVNFKYDNMPNEIEFRGYKISKPKDFLNEVPEFKREMYNVVFKEFNLI